MTPDAISGDHPDEWRPNATDAWHTLADAVPECALFYALYWLDEIQDEGRAAFSFHQQRDLLWRTFQWYGLYTVVREVRHVHEQYLIDGEPSEFALEDNPRKVSEHITTAYPDDVDAGYLNALFENAPAFRGTKGGQHDDGTFQAVLQRGEELFDAISKPERFLRHAAEVFAQEAPDDPVSAFPHPVGGWDVGYGGPAWEGVARHLLRTDDFPKTAWVNQSWGIQHNNNVWLDKIAIPSQNIRSIKEVYEDLNPQAQFGPTPSFYINQALDQLLDRRKEGDMAFVLRYAIEYQDRVGVNVRRLAFSHGIGPEDLAAAEIPPEVMITKMNVGAALDSADAMSVLTQETLPAMIPDDERAGEVLLTEDELTSVSVWMGQLQEANERMEAAGVGSADLEVSSERARDVAFAYEKYLRIIRDPSLDHLEDELEFAASQADRKRLEGIVQTLQKFI